jgi:hypothetical protein
MAELEIGVMSRQYLGQRIPTIEKMANEVQTWATERKNLKGRISSFSK